jgi:hypothetical protein
MQQAKNPAFDGMPGFLLDRGGVAFRRLLLGSIAFEVLQEFGIGGKYDGRIRVQRF